MQSIAITSSERKDLIREMKRERQPSRRLRLHIVLLASEGLSPTEIARLLFCSRTTVYAVAARFARQKRAAFLDRRRRGPKPSFQESANERIDRLVEEGSPASHGWLRSRWSCKLLAVELLKERAVVVSPETIRRRLHRLGFRWRRPRPLPPEKDPLPSWSPESNPVELVWCSLHEAVSRNHQCAGLDDLMEFAEGYLKERQPFMLKLAAIYDQLERSPP
jgi:transposase